jgi:hypothetical protein
VISKIKDADQRVTGTPFLYQSEAEEAKDALTQADLYIQKAMDAWETQPYIVQEHLQTAFVKAEEALDLANQAFPKALIVIVGVPVAIVTIVVSVALVRKRRKISMRA